MFIGSKRSSETTMERAEARLATLRAPNAVAASHTPSIQHKPGLRVAARGRWLTAVALLFVLCVAALAVAKGAEVGPFEGQAAPHRESGSGRLVVPVSAGDTLLRVSINPAVDKPGAWFWCLDSDRGLRFDQRHCAAAGVRDPATGDITIDAVLHLDPVTVTGAMFFVQMYCRDACSWQASTAPGASSAAAGG
jgi:hypothetical protein